MSSTFWTINWDRIDLPDEQEERWRKAIYEAGPSGKPARLGFDIYQDGGRFYAWDRRDDGPIDYRGMTLYEFLDWVVGIGPEYDPDDEFIDPETPRCARCGSRLHGPESINLHCIPCSDELHGPAPHDPSDPYGLA